MKKVSRNGVSTEVDIIRVKSLNEKLKKEEVRIRIFAENLQISMNKMVEEKVIDDYNFQTRLCLFSYNRACNKRHKVEKGDPFYEDENYGMFSLGQDEDFYTEDWSCGMGILTKGEVMCYTMHCICEHSELTWQDLIDVEEVWIELKVDYQFFVNTPLPRPLKKRVE